LKFKRAKNFISSCDTKVLTLPYIVQDSGNLLGTSINLKHENIRDSILKYYINDTAFRKEMEESVGEEALKQKASKAVTNEFENFNPLTKNPDA